jgi:hypothetical protein
MFVAQFFGFVFRVVSHSVLNNIHGEKNDHPSIHIYTERYTPHSLVESFSFVVNSTILCYVALTPKLNGPRARVVNTLVAHIDSLIRLFVRRDDDDFFSSLMIF